MSYRRLGQFRGDPGFFGSLVKGIGKLGKFGKFVPGVGQVIGALELGASIGRPIGRAIAGGPLKNIGLPSGVRIGGPAFPGIGLSPGMGGVRTGVGGSTLGGYPRRRYRRMNVGNTRALRRSMRRVQGFAKLAKATIQFTKTTRMKKGARCA